MKGWVSWSELSIVLLVSAVIYYGYLFVVYFKRRLKSSKNNQQPVTWRREMSGKEIKDSTTTVSTVPINTQVHELMNELNQVFAAAVHDQLNKQQIIEAIKNKLIKYPSVASSVFREAIHQHIISETTLQLNIVILQEEMNSLW